MVEKVCSHTYDDANIAIISGRELSNYVANYLAGSFTYASIILLSRIYFILLDRRRAGLNAFAGRSWPAGRTLPITDKIGKIHLLIFIFLIFRVVNTNVKPLHQPDVVDSHHEHNNVGKNQDYHRYIYVQLHLISICEKNRDTCYY